MLNHSPNFSAKFKTGMARYRPLGRDELEAMLKEEEVRSLQAASNNGSLEISDEDLQHLLDRSDLYDKWQNATRNQHDTSNAGKFESSFGCQECFTVLKLTCNILWWKSILLLYKIVNQVWTRWEADLHRHQCINMKNLTSTGHSHSTYNLIKWIRYWSFIQLCGLLQIVVTNCIP